MPPFTIFIGSDELLLQAFHVVVTEHPKLFALRSHERAVNDTCVRKTVDDNRIVAVGNRSDRTHHAHVSIVEYDGSFFAHISGQPALELLMPMRVTRQHSRSHRGPQANFVDGVLSALLNAFVADEAEVVVDGPDDNVSPLKLHSGSGNAFQYRLGKVIVLHQTVFPEIAAIGIALGKEIFINLPCFRGYFRRFYIIGKLIRKFVGQIDYAHVVERLIHWNRHFEVSLDFQLELDGNPSESRPSVLNDCFGSTSDTFTFQRAGNELLQ